MINSKQRAYLRKLAINIEPIFQIGKNGLVPEITEAVADALEAREIVKVSVLKNCLYEPKDLANMLAERTQSEMVQQIGRKIVLYKPSKNKPKIVLP